MRTKTKNEGGREYGGGKLNREQWEDLRRLVNAPHKMLTLIVTDWPEFVISKRRAEALIQAGVAEYFQGGQSIRPSDPGLRMVSSFGLYS